ncbi:MAG: hypothetical protein Q4D51_00500 [Eubacteriales bacterium]|nr:hypothetical protein [Eubacteriales bacterium]
MGQNYISVLIETLEKKRDALQNILRITKTQEQIAKGSVYQEEEMERALNEKDIQIARINTLDEGFQSVYERVRAEVQRQPDLYRKDLVHLQDLIRECTDLGNQIMVLEERNRDRFQSLFAQSKRQYSASKNKANVAQNYFRTMNNTKILDAYFVDKKQ